MDKKTLGIDIDGTLADSISPWLLEAQKRHNIKSTKERIHAYHLETVFTSMSKEEVSDIYKYVWKNSSQILLEDKDIPTILDNLHSIFDIYITTAASGDDATLGKWLKDNNIPYEKMFHFTSFSQKHALSEVDIYIDDFEGVAERVAQTGKSTILLRQPWNDKFIKINKNPNILIAYNWREIEEILLKKFK